MGDPQKATSETQGSTSAQEPLALIFAQSPTGNFACSTNPMSWVLSASSLVFQLSRYWKSGATAQWPAVRRYLLPSLLPIALNPAVQGFVGGRPGIGGEYLWNICTPPRNGLPQKKPVQASSWPSKRSCSLSCTSTSTGAFSARRPIRLLWAGSVPAACVITTEFARESSEVKTSPAANIGARLRFRSSWAASRSAQLERADETRNSLPSRSASANSRETAFAPTPARGGAAKFAPPFSEQRAAEAPVG